MAIKRKRVNRGDRSAVTRLQSAATTRERLIEAAKQHFAEFGLQHASVRAITEIAGVNSALVGYHFGSKRALYEEVVHRTAKRLIETRLEALERLRFRHGEDPIPIADLLSAYAAPIVGANDELSKDAAIYLRFFGRMYTEPSDELRSITQSQFTELQNKYIAEISRAIPYVPRDEIIFRFGLLIGALTFLGSKLGVIEMLSGGRVDATDPEYVVSHFVAGYAALFEAPSAAATEKTSALGTRARSRRR